jgi:hypothetical protein
MNWLIACVHHCNAGEDRRTAVSLTLVIPVVKVVIVVGIVSGIVLHSLQFNNNICDE